MRLAATLNAPVGHTLRGKEWIQYDNPYDVGMIGLLGYGACHEAIHEADLTLMLGTDFPYDAFLPQARTIQVDHDVTRLGRRTPLELAVHGDVGATLREVLPLLEVRTDRGFLDEMLRKHERALTRVVGAYTRDVEDHLPIHPEYAASRAGRTRRRRRGLHRGHRHEQRVGRPLPHPQRAPPGDRFVLARLDGQRPPARHRRRVRRTGTPGRLDVRATAD